MEKREKFKLNLSVKSMLPLFFVFFVAVLPALVSPIMVPESWEEESEISQKMERNRSLILQGAINQHREMQESSSFLRCLRSFLKEYFDYPITILITNDRRSVENGSDTMNLVLNALHGEIAVYLLNYQGNPESSWNMSSGLVILVENTIDLESTDFDFLKVCIHECQFVLVLTVPVIDEQTFLLEAENVIELMWKRYVGRILILGSTADFTLIAASVAYRKSEICSPATPVLLNRCQDEFWQKRDLKTIAEFDDSSMNFCTVNVGYLENQPYSWMSNESDQLLGIEGSMIEEILRAMNAKLSRKLIKLSGNETITEQLPFIFFNEEPFDLIIGGLLCDLSINVDYTIAYDLVPIVWMIPVSANVSLRGLVNTFNRHVWITLVCTLLLGVLVRTCLIKGVSLLDLLALVLGVSTYRQPRELSGRLYFLSWSLFGFFLTQFYLGSMADSLVNASNLQIETLKELVSSGLQLAASSRLSEFFDVADDAGNEAEDEAIDRAIRERLVVFEYEKYPKKLADLMHGVNFTVALMVQLNVSVGNSYLPKSRVHVLRESMGNFPLAMATWKSLPYLKAINNKIQRLIEAGLLVYWGGLAFDNGNYDESSAQPGTDSDLKLENLAAGFFVLIIGLLLSCCVLLIEIVAYPSKFFE